MVSSLLVDTLNNPTLALRELYDPSQEITTFPSTVSAHFSKVFESPDAFKEVRASRLTISLFRDRIAHPDTSLGRQTSSGVISLKNSRALSCDGAGYLRVTRDVSLKAGRQQMRRVGYRRGSTQWRFR